MAVRLWHVRLHRTVVGSFFALPTERQQAYLRFAPAFIRQEYRRRATRQTQRS
jgi:hypothetical protein